MDFTVLGPVRASHHGEPVGIGGAKPQALLGALLNEHGRVVPTDRLCAAVWGNEPPSSARGLVHTYVSGMRRAFAAIGQDGLLRREGGGYALDVGDGNVDGSVFERLLDTARGLVASGQPEDAVRAYRAAEALWHGPAFGGVANGYLSAQADRLDELRVTALSERITTELDLGADAALVAELTSLVHEHPLREQLWASLMFALCRLDRRGEALNTFRDADRLLRDELGIEPGDRLRELHQAILADDPALSVANVVTESAPTPVNQLPAGKALIGRSAESVEIKRKLIDRQASAPSIVVLTGAPGIGKSALAVQAAGAVRAEFPDGVLYADLRGYRPSAARGAPDVLAGFLRALGVDEAPDGLDERAALFRSRTDGLRLLIVLDDAACAEVVRPLLPAAAGCAVLLTSRNDLAGLAASHDAHRLRLDVLDAEAARELVVRATGDGARAAEVARACGYHPLAISTATARIPSAGPLADYLGALSDDDLLAALAVDGDERAGVGDRVAGSYAMLDSAAQQVFRAIGASGDADVDPALLAYALAARTPDVLRLLENLVAENLLRRTDSGYTMDRLTAAYARTVAPPQSTMDADPYVSVRSGEPVRPEPHSPAAGAHHPAVRPGTRRTGRRKRRRTGH